MALSFLYLALRAVLGALVRSRRGLDVKDIELLVLRHELELLRRQVARPKLDMADRALLGAAAAHLPRSSRGVLLVTPRTLLRWHRALVCRKWRQRSGRRGRPPLSAEIGATERSSTSARSYSGSCRSVRAPPSSSCSRTSTARTRSGCSLLWAFLGFVVTLGLLAYELRGIQDCTMLRSRAKEIERTSHIEVGKSHFQDWQPGRLGLVDEIGAAWSVYLAVLATWAFVAIRGFERRFGWWPAYWKVLIVLAIAYCVLLLAALAAYEFWVYGRERFDLPLPNLVRRGHNAYLALLRRAAQ
jgi:hypothetical protein